jgi:hypothetical protein
VVLGVDVEDRPEKLQPRATDPEANALDYYTLLTAQLHQTGAGQKIPIPEIVPEDDDTFEAHFELLTTAFFGPPWLLSVIHRLEIFLGSEYAPEKRS